MSSLLFYMMILYHMQFFYALLLVLFRWRCRSTANSASIYFPTTAENPTTEALFYCINSHLYVVPINRSDYIRRLDVIHFSQHYSNIDCNVKHSMGLVSYGGQCFDRSVEVSVSFRGQSPQLLWFGVQFFSSFILVCNLCRHSCTRCLVLCSHCIDNDWTQRVENEKENEKETVIVCKICMI